MGKRREGTSDAEGWEMTDCLRSTTEDSGGVIEELEAIGQKRTAGCGLLGQAHHSATSGPLVSDFRGR